MTNPVSNLVAVILNELLNLIRFIEISVGIFKLINYLSIRQAGRCGVVVFIAAQLHSIKSEVRFCAGSNFVCDVSEICHGEDL